jgi:hypothetical protein
MKERKVVINKETFIANGSGHYYKEGYKKGDKPVYSRMTDGSTKPHDEWLRMREQQEKANKIANEKANDSGKKNEEAHLFPEESSKGSKKK